MPLGAPRSVVCGGAVAAAAVVACASSTARATTQPGVLSISKLVITDAKVIFRRDDFMTRSGIPHYPRGTDVRYDIHNRGSRPFSLNVLGSTTGSIPPGKQRTILVYWPRRGKFVFQVRPNGPNLRIWVV